MTEIDELRDRIQFLEALAGISTSVTKAKYCHHIQWQREEVPQLDLHNLHNIRFIDDGSLRNRGLL